MGDSTFLLLTIPTIPPTDGQALTWNAATSDWLPQTIISFTAGGDLSGTSSSQTVIAIHGASVPAAGSLTMGNVLQVSGSSAVTYGAVNLAGGSNYVTGLLPVGNQAAQSLSGDVTGTTAGATVVKIQGNTFASGSPTKGQFVVATSASSYGPVTLSGDISESSSTAGLLEVTGLLSHPLPSLSDGYLNWTGSAWQLSTVSGGAAPPVPAGEIVVGTGSSIGSYASSLLANALTDYIEMGDTEANLSLATSKGYLRTAVPLGGTPHDFWTFNYTGGPAGGYSLIGFDGSSFIIGPQANGYWPGSFQGETVYFESGSNNFYFVPFAGASSVAIINNTSGSDIRFPAAGGGGATRISILSGDPTTNSPLQTGVSTAVSVAGSYPLTVTPTATQFSNQVIQFTGAATASGALTVVLPAIVGGATGWSIFCDFTQATGMSGLSSITFKVGLVTSSSTPSSSIYMVVWDGTTLRASALGGSGGGSPAVSAGEIVVGTGSSIAGYVNSSLTNTTSDYIAIGDVIGNLPTTGILRMPVTAGTKYITAGTSNQPVVSNVSGSPVFGDASFSYATLSAGYEAELSVGGYTFGLVSGGALSFNGTNIGYYTSTFTSTNPVGGFAFQPNGATSFQINSTTTDFLALGGPISGTNPVAGSGLIRVNAPDYPGTTEVITAYSSLVAGDMPFISFQRGSWNIGSKVGANSTWNTGTIVSPDIMLTDGSGHVVNLFPGGSSQISISGYTGISVASSNFTHTNTGGGFIFQTNSATQFQINNASTDFLALGDVPANLPTSGFLRMPYNSGSAHFLTIDFGGNMDLLSLNGSVFTVGNSGYYQSRFVSNSGTFVQCGSTYILVQAGSIDIEGVTTSTTAPSAGGADPLPLTPAGYMAVTIDGVSRNIAYY